VTTIWSAAVLASAAEAASALPVPSAIGEALNWMVGALLGDVAKSIAVIAVACIGLMMLSGRIGSRRTIEVLVGCFILFGAGAIAGGILAAVSRTGGPPPGQIASQPPASPDYPDSRIEQHDPYAGAAVPPTR